MPQLSRVDNAVVLLVEALEGFSQGGRFVHLQGIKVSQQSAWLSG